MITFNGLRFFPEETAAGEENENEEEETTAAATEETPEEIRAERDRLKAQADKARTTAARAAKAERDRERKAAEEAGETEKLKLALKEETEKREALEAKTQRASARSLAVAAKAFDADDVVGLLDFDAMDDPTDEAEVKSVIAQMAKDKPYMFKPKTTKKVDAGKGGAGNEGHSSFNEEIRARSGR